MTDPHFKCPYCSQPLEAASDMFGETVACPACGKQITIPGSTPPPLPQYTVNIHTPQSAKRRTAWKVALGFVFLALVIWVVSAIKPTPSSSPAKPTDGLFAKLSRSLSIDETPLLVEPATNIDRSLVFIRYIDLLSSDWPSPSTNQAVFAKAVTDYRKQLSLAREYIQSAALDKELTDILDSQEALLGLYLNVLHNMNNIDEAALARATKEISESSFNAGYAGGGAAAIAADNDAGFWGSALVGLGTYAFSMWLQESEKSTARNQAYNSLVQQEIEKYESAYRKYESQLRNMSGSLSSRHNWEPTETGHSLPQTHLDQKQAAVNNADWETLASLNRSEAAARPRDPFILAQSALTDAWAIGSEVSVSAQEQSERKLLDALALLPPDDFYGPIRSFYYALAGQFALAKAELHARGKGYVGGPFDSSRSIRLFLAARKYDPYDSSGWLRLQLSRAYAYAGHFSKAVSLAEEIRGLYSSDAGFMYDLACMYSAAKKYPQALDALTKCIRECGYSNIKWAQTDPDLTDVRKRYASEFQQLTAIRTRADIEWGLLWDDPILRNDSPFPLTNVRFTPRITSKGQVYTKELRTEYLAPGSGCSWPDVFSIPGSTYDSYHYKVVSDQGTVSTQ